MFTNHTYSLRKEEHVLPLGTPALPSALAVQWSCLTMPSEPLISSQKLQKGVGSVQKHVLHFGDAVYSHRTNVGSSLGEDTGATICGEID